MLDVYKQILADPPFVGDSLDAAQRKSKLVCVCVWGDGARQNPFKFRTASHIPQPAKAALSNAQTVLPFKPLSLSLSMLPLIDVSTNYRAVLPLSLSLSCI